MTAAFSNRDILKKYRIKKFVPLVYVLFLIKTEQKKDNNDEYKNCNLQGGKKAFTKFTSTGPLLWATVFQERDY